MFKITPQLLTEVLNYLSNQKWLEVNELIIQLSRLERIESQEDQKLQQKEEASTKREAIKKAQSRS